MMDAEYEQVGVIALRDPVSGAFLPAVPLYVRAGDGVPAKLEGLIAALTQLLIGWEADEARGADPGARDGQARTRETAPGTKMNDEDEDEAWDT